MLIQQFDVWIFTIDCEMCSKKCALLGEVLVWLLEVGCRQSREAPWKLASELRFEVGGETAQ